MTARALAILVLVAASAAVVRAGEVEVAPAWTVGGGPEGGYVALVEVAPGDPSWVYASSGNHLFASRDAGRTWRLTGSASVSLGVDSLAVDPLVPSRVYAGFRDRGVWRSDDAGATWEPARDGLPFSRPWYDEYQEVELLAASRERPGTLFAGVGSRGGTPRSVYRSIDRGAHWQRVLDGVSFVCLEVGAGSPEVAYACGGEGLQRSEDGGATWGLVAGLDGVRARSVASVPAEPDRLWVGADGVWRSSDRGESWELSEEGLDNPIYPACPVTVTSLAVDPLDPERVVAGSWHATHRSTDGGRTWTILASPLELDGVRESQVVAVALDRSWFLRGGSPLGVMRLDGDAWVPSRTGFAGVSVAWLTVDPARPEVAFVSGNQYTITLPGVHRTLDGAATWSDVTAGLGLVDVYALAMDPADGRHLLAAMSVGRGMGATADGGQTWAAVDLPGEDWWPVDAIAFAPSDPSWVYAATWESLLRSSDGGATWVGLPTEWGVGPPIAVDPLAANLLYAAQTTYGQRVAVSTDHGTTWRAAGNLPGPAHSLAIHPARRERLWAVSYHLVRSDDMGASWARVQTPVRVGALALVAADPDWVLVGSEDGGGVFESRDGGETWQPLGGWLEPPPGILALAASPDGDLVWTGTTASVIHLHRTPESRRVGGRRGTPAPPPPPAPQASARKAR